MRCTALKNKTALFLCVCLLLLSCGCTRAERKETSFFAMDTIMQITAYGGPDDALAEARDVIEELDAALDATDSQSTLSLLRNGDAVPKTILEPLQTAKKIASATDGALDVTLFPLSDAWGFYTKQYRVPPQTELRTLLQNRGSVSVQDGRLVLSDGTKLDLGSVAKGYAADCAAQTLRQNGVQGAVLALGGNVQTVGQKPDGSDWRVTVADPLHPDGTVCDLLVGETAVVTSGSYQRSFTENGKTYHHILDPETGAPAESGLLSVTVVCADGTTADGLSTALFILGLDRGSALWRSGEIAFDALWITDRGEIFVTAGLASRMEQTNETYGKANIIE
jgi:thiamine biosynthesis lipoprotein